ncbi:MAG: hypothetical protein ACLTBV_03270 [Enterocloster bolteae]
MSKNIVKQHLRRMEDRVVLLTGGGGIARGVARAFADEGAKHDTYWYFSGRYGEKMKNR